MTVPQAVISIRDATKRFGDVVALDAVSLDIREGEFFALLGPSGCGKTTLLRSIGGFAELDSGHVLLDGNDLGRTKPYARPVNMMFQSYALFPHMRVRDNVAYGLRAERLPKHEVAERVESVLRTVGMLDYIDRRPHQLSGGQRQRVALARAIVKRPRVLLLDEPLAALDRKLRQEMQLELKRMQHDIGLTFVVVTHDQEEAMTMADRIAVMQSGRVLQVASPHEIYTRPADRFVASFVGTMNLFPIDAGPDGTTIGGFGAVRGVQPPAGAAWAGIRPDAGRLVAAGDATAPDAAVASVTVRTSAFVGTQVHLELDIEGTGLPFTLTLPAVDAVPADGSAWRLEVAPADILLLPDEPTV